MSDKVELKNRAPETQLVLRRINGWGINWGITFTLLLFAILLYAAIKVEFDQSISVPLEARSSWEVVATSPGTLGSVDQLSLDIDGESFIFTRQKERENKRISFRPDHPLPAGVAFPYPLQAERHKSVNILAIIFKGLY
ncbi:MAG TPA: hypothetical protein ENJ82_16345 [Bacteroidetes bacterium]|nr:hypothetical protein [Bacteroidota bacterium]